ncbi:sarcosine oxidase subunit gamma [Tabrizicola sp.]|uniref:sarcosine oxidase subunit gamma n=1 Tax=Tabrizicola sp. TaxID=2005166 RepID=UPI003D29BF44
MANHWKSLTALGHDAAETVQIGPYKIVERFDVALASLALRRGQDKAFEAAAKKAGVPLPDASRHAAGKVYSAFWTTPEMWLVEAYFATHEDIVAHLKPAFGDSASITEQTDAWVRFDVSGEGLVALFERLTNLDLANLPDGFASRTVMEHLGVYLIRHSANMVALYGPRSSAQGLLHALEITAKSVI